MSRDDERRPGLKIETMDLRGVTRPGSETRILLDTGDYSDGGPLKEWIRCGRIKLQAPDRRGSRPWILSARAIAGVTDFEHDSAYIFQIPVVGVELEFVENGWTYLVAFIAGEPEDLRLPISSGYDPTKLPGAETCDGSDCGHGKPHGIVPEGHWAGPPPNAKVWAKLVGRRIEVRFGTPEKD